MFVPRRASGPNRPPTYIQSVKVVSGETVIARVRYSAPIDGTTMTLSMFTTLPSGQQPDTIDWSAPTFVDLIFPSDITADTDLQYTDLSGRFGRQSPQTVPYSL